MQDFEGAERQLANIQEVRENAERGLKMSLSTKHQREIAQLNEQNQKDFFDFSAAWDQKIGQVQNDCILQMQSHRQKQVLELNEVRAYLEQTMGKSKHKITPDAVRFRFIQETLIR